MLALLLESALRTAVLGVGLALVLKFCRVKNVQAQLTIWTVVLLSAFFMPSPFPLAEFGT